MYSVDDQRLRSIALAHLARLMDQDRACRRLDEQGYVEDDCFLRPGYSEGGQPMQRLNVAEKTNGFW